MDKNNKMILFALLFLILVCAKQYFNESTSYWVWRYSDLSQLTEGSDLIIYQGNITKDWEYEGIGVQPQPLEFKEISILFRMYTLGSVEDFLSLYRSKVREWNYFDVEVVGLEIDYDSPSSMLDEYKNWLKKLRVKIDTRLSVTSLSTYIWDNPLGLKRLSSEVDFISMQLYQGYDPHEQHKEVIDWMNSNKVSHRVGVTRSVMFEDTGGLCLQYCSGINVFLNIKE